MKKLIIIILVGGLGYAAGTVYGKIAAKREDKLPFRLKAGVTMAKPEANGLQVVVKGVIQIEQDKFSKNKDIMLKTDTGDAFVLLNPPFDNALLMNKTNGKTATIKGFYLSQTKSRRYPGIYIQDILEVN
jgi:hypothetical protein